MTETRNSTACNNNLHRACGGSVTKNSKYGLKTYRCGCECHAEGEE